MGKFPSPLGGQRSGRSYENDDDDNVIAAASKQPAYRWAVWRRWDPTRGVDRRAAGPQQLRPRVKSRS